MTVHEITQRRLVPSMPTDGWWSWLATGVVVVIAAGLRLLWLDQPKGQVFDEVYYAVDAHHLLQHGVEWDDSTGRGSFVVHPPLGKWLIGLGEKLFGYNEIGWRLPSAVAGVIAVLILTRLARRLFRSTLLGCAAGLLMGLDGFAVVLSRVALLDIFLLLFVLAAFACLVVDRDQRRAQWLAALRGGADRPPFAIPWWRLAAAAMAGCAMSVKWSALWYLFVLVFLIYVWEAGARRSAGVRHPWHGVLREETRWVLVFAAVVVAVYLAAWTGWFASDTGWDRHWLASQGQPEPLILGALENLWHYHQEMLHFHDTLSTPHPYQSWPWQWLLLGRPVLLSFTCPDPCTAASPVTTVLLLGTPVLWWSFIPALGGLVWFGISRRDWRPWAIGLGALAGIVPWFPYELQDRTMFYFYAAPAEPFLILAVVYVLGVLARPPADADPDRVLLGAVLSGLYMLVVAANFAWFYSIYTSRTITYSQWLAKLWLGNRWR